MALTSSTSDDWSGGIYRGRRAPANAFYDGVNALIDDEGQLYKRGGSAYYSASNGAAAFIGVFAPYLPVVQAYRVFMQLHPGQTYVLDGSLNPTGTAVAAPDDRRPVVLGGYLIWPGLVGPQLSFYAGSLDTTGQYTTGTVSTTAGGTTVTGAGTSWVGNLDPGTTLSITGGRLGIVKSVTDNTHLELSDPWAGTTAAGQAYTAATAAQRSFTTPFRSDGGFLGIGGSGSPRLIMATGNRAYLSDRGDPQTFSTDVYHELGAGVEIIGVEGAGDTALLFTTAGVWAIGNLSFDPVDDFGNIQHVVQRVTGELVLWGDPGIVSWKGSVIVPGVDDVVILNPNDGSVTSISGDEGNQKIRPLYRQYVASGYRPGYAAVYKGHYILPVLNGTTLVDVLVCRLDRGAVWTRWSGHGAATGYAVLPDPGGAAKLLGARSLRVTDMSGAFAPTTSNATEADATTPDCTITTRDFPTSQRHGFVQRLRLRYELTNNGAGSTPTVAVAFSSDADAGSFSTLTDKGLQAGGTGGSTSDGSKYNWWSVLKKRERIRYRITQTGAAGSFILRSLEMLTRPPGRQ